MNVIRKQKLMAVASAGGHWVQLHRLLPAWQNREVVYVSTRADVMMGIDERSSCASKTYTVTDANAKTVFRLLLLLAQITRIVFQERPPVIVSTGAAPGCLALVLGKLLGAKTIWIDSIANSERVSLSGRLISPLADIWLTQWESVAASSFLGRNPQFVGTIL